MSLPHSLHRPFLALFLSLGLATAPLSQAAEQLRIGYQTVSYTHLTLPTIYSV